MKEEVVRGNRRLRAVEGNLDQSAVRSLWVGLARREVLESHEGREEESDGRREVGNDENQTAVENREEAAVHESRRGARESRENESRGSREDLERRAREVEEGNESRRAVDRLVGTNLQQT